MLRSRRVHPRGVLAVTAAFFVALTVAAVLVGTLPLDQAIRHDLLRVATPRVLAVMHVVNALGYWPGLVPAAAIMFLAFAEARRRWWLWSLLMILAGLLPDVVKLAVGRPRPEDLSLGFPSGHATASAAYFGAIMYLAGALPARWRIGTRVLAAVLMVFVAVARVMLRAHWPSDVAGGMTLGLGLASAAALVADRPATIAPSAD